MMERDPMSEAGHFGSRAAFDRVAESSEKLTRILPSVSGMADSAKQTLDKASATIDAVRAGRVFIDVTIFGYKLLTISLRAF